MGFPPHGAGGRHPPGWAKIAFTLRADPLDPAASIARIRSIAK
jgi:hypothetical protein